MALAKSRTKIQVRGGGFLLMREISPSPSDTFLDVGYLQSTNWQDERNMLEAIDERGLQVDFVEGGQVVTITSQLMQADIDVINLLKGSASKYFDVYYYAVLADGKYQEFSAPVAKIMGGPKLNFAANTMRTVELQLRLLPSKGAYTRTPTAFNIAAGEFYVVSENVSKQGPPSDTASATASACL